MKRVIDISAVGVSWSPQYIAFRDALRADFNGTTPLYITREMFSIIGAKCIDDFRDNADLHRSARSLLQQVGIKAVIGHRAVVLTNMPRMAVDDAQWPAIISAGVKRIVEHMGKGDLSTYEYSMTQSALRNHMTFWPSDGSKNDMLVAEFQKHNLTCNVTLRKVLIRRVQKETELPRMAMHNGTTLLGILLKPAISAKRRWAKGYTHALSVSSSSGVFMLLKEDERITDATGKSCVTVEMKTHDVLLVNRAALNILVRMFETSSHTLSVTPL